ncbi:thioesterase family protein [Pokkaliibacter sp. MBI-7]|uniref:acyl-CoA thioesterase n=1 Tax=Pokkaliibacter sp. MBI-7 TaxID=3040600 RepID=UPI00244D45B5|nr:thioesterase family protein [Pokkaliibacter sp. MBI-7]MDH2436114.1 thioesterase family protein [Pokkaliibacter sp. MBI-7]
MFSKMIEPGFYDTDALGHINNTRLPVWFELARNDLFPLFTPDMDPKKWNLILARLEVDFIGELFFNQPVEVKTWIERIGNSSFVVLQEAWQGETLGARGRVTMVYYDWTQKTSVRITDDIRERLQLHMAIA